MKKKVLITIASVITMVALLITILTIGGCSGNNGNTATSDEPTETRIETVTEIATDAQGNTYVEESTEVVEVMAQGDKSEDEKAESSKQDTSAKDENKTNDKNESSITNASADSKTNSDKNTSKTDTSTGKNSSSSKVESSKVNNSSSSSKNESSKVDTSNKNSSTNSNKNNTSSSTNKNNTSTSKPSSSSSTSNTSKKTWHEAEYEYINHPAETKKVWVVDKEAYTYEEPVYEYKVRTICLECGEDTTENALKHSKNHALNGENGAYSNKKIPFQVGTKTVEVPEEGHWETVVVKEAWTEKVLVREAGYY